MTHQLLDTTENSPLRKPIPWWRAGLLGGVAAAVFIMGFKMFVEAQESWQPWQEYVFPMWIRWTTVIVMLAIVTIRLSLFGEPKLHYKKNMAAAALFGATFGILTTAALFIESKINPLFIFDLSLGEFPVVIVIFALVACVISSMVWLIVWRWQQVKSELQGE